MSGKEKISKGLSTAVVALVFLLLIVQLSFFVYSAIENVKSRQIEGIPLSENKPEGNKTTEDVPQAPSPKLKKKLPKKQPSSAKDTVATALRGEIKQSESTEDKNWKWDMVELNSADSAMLVSLSGIGPYYAKKILEYRSKLWGSFHDAVQLLEIRGIDSLRFARIRERIYIDSASVRYIDLNTISVDSLAIHPYIGPYAAKGIERYRNVVSPSVITLQDLVDNGVLTESSAQRIERIILPSHRRATLRKHHSPS